MVQPTLVIMAAGMGSRYGGLKQIDPVGPDKEVILDYSIYDALQAGFGRVVFIIKHAIEQAFGEAVLARLQAAGVPVSYVCQELEELPNGLTPPPGRNKPWGTGQAVLCAEPLVSEPFAVINADDFYGREPFEQVSRFLREVCRERPSHFCMAGYQAEHTLTDNGAVSRGICSVDENGFLTAIRERGGVRRQNGGVVFQDEDTVVQLENSTPVSMNFWGFTPDLFEALRTQFVGFLQQNGASSTAEFYLPSVVDRLLQEERADVQVLRTTAQWYGVTYPEDKPVVVQAIRRMIREGVYPERLWK